MARRWVLNPNAAPTRLDPVALSQALLAEAKRVSGPAQCARLGELSSQLHGISPEPIEGDAARVAFWANLYNALVLHCLCLAPLRGSLLWHLRRFDRAAYRVGSHDYPLTLIENGILRVNRRPPMRLRRTLRRSDPRLRAAPGELDPRIHFALNCGARSCPPVESYSPTDLDAQLEAATRSYLQQETRVEAPRGRVVLPRLLRIYRQDFGERRAQLEFVAARTPAVRDLLDSGQRVTVRYAGFDWTVAAPAALRATAR